MNFFHNNFAIKDPTTSNSEKSAKKLKHIGIDRKPMRRNSLRSIKKDQQLTKQY